MCSKPLDWHPSFGSKISMLLLLYVVFTPKISFVRQKISGNPPKMGFTSYSSYFFPYGLASYPYGDPGLTSPSRIQRDACLLIEDGGCLTRNPLCERCLKCPEIWGCGEFLWCSIHASNYYIYILYTYIYIYIYSYKYWYIGVYTLLYILHICIYNYISIDFMYNDPVSIKSSNL